MSYHSLNLCLALDLNCFLMQPTLTHYYCISMECWMLCLSPYLHELMQNYKELCKTLQTGQVPTDSQLTLKVKH